MAVLLVGYGNVRTVVASSSGTSSSTDFSVTCVLDGVVFLSSQTPNPCLPKQEATLTATPSPGLLNYAEQFSASITDQAVSNGASTYNLDTSLPTYGYVGTNNGQGPDVALKTDGPCAPSGCKIPLLPSPATPNTVYWNWSSVVVDFGTDSSWSTADARAAAANCSATSSGSLGTATYNGITTNCEYISASDTKLVKHGSPDDTINFSYSYYGSTKTYTPFVFVNWNATLPYASQNPCGVTSGSAPASCNLPYQTISPTGYLTSANQPWNPDSLSLGSGSYTDHSVTDNGTAYYYTMGNQEYTTVDGIDTVTIYAVHQACGTDGSGTQQDGKAWGSGSGCIYDGSTNPGGGLITDQSLNSNCSPYNTSSQCVLNVMSASPGHHIRNYSDTSYGYHDVTANGYDSQTLNTWTQPYNTYSGVRSGAPKVSYYPLSSCVPGSTTSTWYSTWSSLWSPTAPSPPCPSADAPANQTFVPAPDQMTYWNQCPDPSDLSDTADWNGGTYNSSASISGSNLLWACQPDSDFTTPWQHYYTVSTPYNGLWPNPVAATYNQVPTTTPEDNQTAPYCNTSYGGANCTNYDGYGPGSVSNDNWQFHCWVGASGCPNPGGLPATTSQDYLWCNFGPIVLDALDGQNSGNSADTNPPSKSYGSGENGSNHEYDGSSGPNNQVNINWPAWAPPSGNVNYNCNGGDGVGTHGQNWPDTSYTNTYRNLSVINPQHLTASGAGYYLDAPPVDCYRPSSATGLTGCDPAILGVGAPETYYTLCTAAQTASDPNNYCHYPKLTLTSGVHPQHRIVFFVEGGSLPLTINQVEPVEGAVLLPTGKLE
jgi:hypothetical protein